VSRATSVAALLSTSALVVFLDQLSKWWVMNSFALFESRPVIDGFFNLVFVTNSGAAFGLLAGPQVWWRQLFFVSAAVLALGILVVAYRHYRCQGAIWVVAIALVAGGAVGNLVDRLRFGAVIDFLDFYIQTHHWPAFNVADSAITVGIGLFFLASLRAESHGDVGGSEE